MNEGWNLVDKEPQSATEEAATDKEAEGETTKRPELREASFAWRGGKERQTTGKRHK